MRFISLFAGVGGFDVGMERAGHECVAMVEYDKQAAGVLAHRFPGVPIFCDVRQVSADDLPDADFLTYGFPCQDLSTAGKREGLNGDRSGLFFDATRIIRGLVPRGLRFAVAENVAGLLSADDGCALARCVRELLDIGASEVGWRVLDSQYFGVAQRRRRVFLVASFGGGGVDEILALTEGMQRHPAPSREAGQAVARTVTQGARFSRSRNERVESEEIICRAGDQANAEICEGFAPTLNCISGQRGPLVFQPRKGINSTLDEGQTPVIGYTPASFGQYVEGVDTLKKSGGDVGPSSETVVCAAGHTYPTLDCERGGSNQWVDNGKAIISFQPRIGRNGRGYAAPGEPVPALNGSNAGATSDMRPCVAFGPQNSASQGDSVSATTSPTLDKSKVPGVAQSLSVRRLTPRECERLQGFPDDWTSECAELELDGNTWLNTGKVVPQSDTARYKQMGNAVTVNVAEWIGRRMRSTSEAGK